MMIPQSGKITKKFHSPKKRVCTAIGTAHTHQQVIDNCLFMPDVVVDAHILLAWMVPGVVIFHTLNY
ncbi:MAG: hypothetical protein HC770_08010 [Pseudanabaena sp. CRU_2_10]|nr:hypothetical protein [Pseudanabaena sp. CRU_2_10]